MINKIFVLIIFFIIPINTIASPFISNVSNTKFSDGGTYTISGTGLGTHALEVEWLGGADGNIEQGSGLFKNTQWTADTQSTARQAPEYTTDRSHSGSKSIKSSLPIESQYTSGFIYNNGERFNSIYVTYWVYFDHVDSKGQWKQWRINTDGRYGDGNGEIMESHNYYVDGSNMMNYTMIFCDKASYAQCYPDPDGALGYQSAEALLPPGKWIRREIYAVGSSADGVRDGSLFTSIHKQDEVPTIVRDHDGTIITRLSGSEKWQYFVFENYWGNIDGGTGTKEKIYIDDVFIQTNSRARVEIGNNVVWENCTHREIQIPASWSETNIEFEFNQASFDEGDNVYLFVVDENGNTSNGYPITIGAGNSLTFDINTDGHVNVLDVIMCVNIVLGTATGNADVNGDEQTNIQDVDAIVNDILGV